MCNINRLVLGTAQLGTNYGIANRMGKPDFDTAEAIIKTTWDAGIREFDTAQGYGDSEQVLGEVFQKYPVYMELCFTKSYRSFKHRRNLPNV